MKVNLLRAILCGLKTGSMKRLPYFIFLLIYLVGLGLTANYFVLTDFTLHFSSIFFISTLFFLTYLLFAVTIKRLRHLGFKRPILMSAFLSWAIYICPLGGFLYSRFQLDQASAGVVGQSVVVVLGGWLALMILFLPLLLFARENFFKLSFLKLFLGDLRQGQLQRIPFLGCSFYTNFLFLGGLILFLSILGGLFFGGAQLLQLTMSAENLGALLSLFPMTGVGALYAVYAVPVLVYLVFFYISFVLTIKRMRNIGVKSPILTFILSFIGLIILTILALAFESPIVLTVSYLSAIYITLGLFVLPQGFVQQRPLKILFADIKKGSLRRVAFFGYVLLMYWVANFFVGILGGSFMSYKMQAELNVSTALFVLLTSYMAFVLTVKRLRHINFKHPVTLAFILFLIDFIYCGIGYSSYESSVIELLRTVWLCVDVIILLFLLFTPGNFFKRNEEAKKADADLIIKNT